MVRRVGGGVNATYGHPNRLRLNGRKQRRNIYLKRFRKPLDVVQGHIALRPFHRANKRAMQSGEIGKRFL